MDNEVLLEVKHLYKSFEDVDAVADVSFVSAGENLWALSVRAAAEKVQQLG